MKINLFRRAEQLADWEAPQAFEPTNCQRRIGKIQNQLRNIAECDHRGRNKFSRISGGYGAQFQCAICNRRYRAQLCVLGEKYWATERACG